jgi:hypothetical protein
VATVLEKATSEREFQRQVLELAALLGWKRAHFRNSQDPGGRWSTPVAADAEGWPDLTLVRPPRILFLELKTERGRLSTAQVDWMELLGRCTGVEAHVVRPSDWAKVEQLLR